jgi:hypothetical protein
LVSRELRSTRLDQFQDVLQGRRAAVLVAPALSGAALVVVVVVVVAGMAVITAGVAVIAVAARRTAVSLGAVAGVVLGGAGRDGVVAMAGATARSGRGFAVEVTCAVVVRAGDGCPDCRQPGFRSAMVIGGSVCRAL